LSLLAIPTRPPTLHSDIFGADAQIVFCYCFVPLFRCLVCPTHLPDLPSLFSFDQPKYAFLFKQPLPLHVLAQFCIRVI
jgi:hypothetical protein